LIVTQLFSKTIYNRVRNSIRDTEELSRKFVGKVLGSIVPDVTFVQLVSRWLKVHFAYQKANCFCTLFRPLFVAFIME